jgi:hypothetical protein
MNKQKWQSDPWLQYLPDLHRTLAAPDLRNGLPRSFISLSHEQSCAWWETLRYQLRSLLGWRSLPAGLAWWYDSCKPTLDDPILHLMAERWNTRGELDYFAAREWESGGDSFMSGPTLEWNVENYEPTPGWLRDLHRRPPLMKYGPYGGGYNPLHLGHSDLIAGKRPAGPSSGSHQMATRKAVLVVSGFDSWQQELLAYGSSLPSLGDRSWHVEVFDRQIGYLGTFRQSQLTGHWFQGKHSIHMAGNPSPAASHP